MADLFVSDFQNQIIPRYKNYYLSLETIIKAINVILDSTSTRSIIERKFIDLLYHELSKVNYFSRLQIKTLTAAIHSTSKQISHRNYRRTLSNADDATDETSVSALSVPVLVKDLDACGDELSILDNYVKLNYAAFKYCLTLFDSKSGNTDFSSSSNWFLAKLANEPFLNLPFDTALDSLIEAHKAARIAIKDELQESETLFVSNGQISPDTEKGETISVLIPAQDLMKVKVALSKHCDLSTSDDVSSFSESSRYYTDSTVVVLDTSEFEIVNGNSNRGLFLEWEGGDFGVLSEYYERIEGELNLPDGSKLKVDSIKDEILELLNPANAFQLEASTMFSSIGKSKLANLKPLVKIERRKSVWLSKDLKFTLLDNNRCMELTSPDFTLSSLNDDWHFFPFNVLTVTAQSVPPFISNLGLKMSPQFSLVKYSLSLVFPGKIKHEIDPAVLHPVIQVRHADSSFETRAADKSTIISDLLKADTLPLVNKSETPKQDAQRISYLIEPKTFMANERTLISWINSTVVISGLGTYIMVSSLKDKQTTGGTMNGVKWTVGISLAVFAVIFMWFSIIIYIKRSQRIKERMEIGSKKANIDSTVFRSTLGPLLFGLVMAVLVLYQSIVT